MKRSSIVTKRYRSISVSCKSRDYSHRDRRAESIAEQSIIHAINRHKYEYSIGTYHDLVLGLSIILIQICAYRKIGYTMLICLHHPVHPFITSPHSSHSTHLHSFIDQKHTQQFAKNSHPPKMLLQSFSGGFAKQTHCDCYLYI